MQKKRTWKGQFRKKVMAVFLANAMLFSLVPISASAADEIVASAAILNSAEVPSAEENIIIPQENAAKLRLKFTKVDRTISQTIFTIALENAYWNIATEQDFEKLVSLENGDGDRYTDYTTADLVSDFSISADRDTVQFQINRIWNEKDQLYILLPATLTRTSANTQAKLTVESNDITIKNGEDKVFVSVLKSAIQASVKEIVDLVPEEMAYLHKKGILITDVIENSWDDGDQLRLKLNRGFAFLDSAITLQSQKGVVQSPASLQIEEREIMLTLPDGWSGQEKFSVCGIQIEAVSAEAGAQAVISIYMEELDRVDVVVAQVIANKMELKTDTEEILIFYSGTDVKNTGLTVDDTHETPEITIGESFAGIWSNREKFMLSLPEGVWVTDVEITDNEMLGISDAELLEIFEDAYREGEHRDFVFKKRTFAESNPASDIKEEREPQYLSFVLTLVADLQFSGVVSLTLSGDGMDTQEIKIAEFVPPYQIQAEQNDLKIDYRNTALPSDLLVQEPEAGLWAKKTAFSFAVEKMQIEDAATYETDAASALEIKGDAAGELGFSVERKSQQAAMVTIRNISVFLDRTLPAGNYALSVSTTMETAYSQQTIFAPKHRDDAGGCTKNCVVYLCDVSDEDGRIKENFIHIITAGRDRDDATFLTEVAIPIGQKQIRVGEQTVSIDTAAYINMDGYTMLPVRAVSTALGIHAENVLWDASSRTVTILYGQHIISMTADGDTVSVNGSKIPAVASAEIIGGRVFLSMRDLATALGITDLVWDEATKTVLLNRAAFC